MNDPHFASTSEQALTSRIALEKRLLSRAASTQAGIPRRADVTGPWPLSWAQRRLWFLERFGDELQGYHIPVALEFEGSVDESALKASVIALIKRHEVLRMRVETTATGEICATTAEACGNPLETLSVSPPDGESQAQLDLLLERESQRPLDLSAGLLLRTILVRLGERHSILLLVIHHIAADGWSIGVLVRDLAALYSERVTGTPASLPPLPFQYGDYAVWQKTRLDPPALKRLSAFWRDQLAGAPELELPVDRRRPAVQTFRGARLVRRLPHAVLAELKNLSRKEGATLFMTLLTLVQALLARYCLQNDVVTGTVVSNRNRSDFADAVGIFLNTVVIRTHLPGELPFREALRRVTHSASAAFDHAELPFEALVEELRPERRLDHTPVFQVMVQLQQKPPGAAGWAGLRVRPYEQDPVSAKFDLSFHFTEGEDLRTAIVYNADLFEVPTIHRMLEHFERLVEGVLWSPDRPLEDLPLTNEAEMEFLRGCNATATDYRSLWPGALERTA